MGLRGRLMKLFSGLSGSNPAADQDDRSFLSAAAAQPLDSVRY